MKPVVVTDDHAEKGPDLILQLQNFLHYTKTTGEVLQNIEKGTKWIRKYNLSSYPSYHPKDL
jgi:hypothetical protein